MTYRLGKDGWSTDETIIEIRDKEIESLRHQFAECQAREKMQQDAMLAVLCDHDGVPCFSGSDGDRKVIADALAMPSDSTALDAMLKQAKHEMALLLLRRFEVGYWNDAGDVIGEIRRMAEELK